MTVNSHIVALIDRCERLWAAETEVARTYWDSPVRTLETDRLWVVRQMYKELLDGALPSLLWARDNFDAVAGARSRAGFLEEIDVLREEFIHYMGFAGIYEALSGETPSAAALRSLGAWPENDRLQALRARHRRDHGELGLRAQRFTEGGYCTLYSEGMKLAGRGGIDRMIAAACEVVFNDEFGHMLRGIADLDGTAGDLSARDWTVLGDLVEEQLRHRVTMRNAQFSGPVAPERLAAIQDGACEPLAFDYQRAFGQPRP
ncbi:MAG: hypothetical protein AB7O49_13870 [Sphingomonadales bacterium]